MGCRQSVDSRGIPAPGDPTTMNCPLRLCPATLLSSPALGAVTFGVVALGTLPLGAQTPGKPAATPTTATAATTVTAAGPLWAFKSPVRPPLPAPGSSTHPIDRLVEARLRAEGLPSVPVADRTTLIRRLSFDLTGLPPTPAEVDAFLADARPSAYERLVDGLLASPHHAERLTQHWLDLARYADSNGYHMDAHRDQWKWRDWVLDAFAKNMPFDEFTTQQLAGDLLPNLTIEKMVATGFNRNHMTNVEGGADPAEYANRYVIDRVNTFGTTFLGLTVGCAECHDHKYDPLSQREFYQLYAFFDDVRETGLDGFHGNAAPTIGVPTPSQTAELMKLAAVEQEKKQALDHLLPKLQSTAEDWARQLAEVDPTPVPRPQFEFTLDGDVIDSVTGRQGTPSGQGRSSYVPGMRGQALHLLGEGRSYAIGDVGGFGAERALTVTAWVDVLGRGGPILAKLDDGLGERGWSVDVLNRHARFLLQHHKNDGKLIVQMREPFPDGWHHLAATYDGSSRAAGVRIFVDGQAVTLEVLADDLHGTTSNHVPLRIGRWETLLPYSGSIDELRLWSEHLSDLQISALFEAIPRSQASALESAATKSDDRVRLVQFYRDFIAPEAAALRAELLEIQREVRRRLDELPQCMVMADRPEPRTARVLIRGNYRRLGEVVQPNVPSALPPLPEDGPRNRLTLARWLFDPAHPLTARVAVNRFWQWMFGRGLVPDGANFGPTGERPSHPKLLDWLAIEFRTSGWDVRKLLRTMVLSNTYRRSARPTPELAKRDPDNRWLGRASRLRFDAETIRDNALAIAGLLDRRIGGASVMPYQPPGYWGDLAFGGGYSGQEWIPSEGADRYRRGLYIYWKRSALYPSLQIFDAPDRELCTPARGRSTTPLQPLVLLNDPVFVEAATAFASRILGSGGHDDSARLDFAYRCCLGRVPSPRERSILLDALRQQRTFVDPGDEGEHTVWVVIASTLLNQDAVLHRN